ncbi:MAG: DNA recombination/repair protein RecA, partial [Erysipelotrichia bacterium]|nr:DNA recombination/repair protein RecA [Erysipelotrichia bacterium]
MATKVKEKKVENLDQRDVLLNDTISQIEKQFGKGSIMKLGDRSNVDVDAISSGSLKIDEALGIGGY